MREHMNVIIDDDCTAEDLLQLQRELAVVLKDMGYHGRIHCHATKKVIEFNTPPKEGYIQV